MTHKIATLCGLTLLLSSCTGTDTDMYPNIKIAKLTDVMHCKHVGNLSSSSKNFGLFIEEANDERLALLKREASKMNATHIIIDDASESGNTTTTTGAAYSCPQ